MKTPNDPAPTPSKPPRPPNLLLGSMMVHPFDLEIEPSEEPSAPPAEGDFEFFAIESPREEVPLSALATDCGHTLSTIACDCVQTLSTLFCLSCEGCSG